MGNDHLNNATYLLNDLLSGDESIDNREDFKNLTEADIRRALKLILENEVLSTEQKNFFIENSWRIFYRDKPPTISEFMTTKYLGPTGLSVYDHVRDTLDTFFHPLSEKRHLILAAGIGWGKSFAATIAILYIVVHLVLMKDPKKYFGLSQASSIVNAMISFSLKKAKQLLVQPFYQILLSSPFFHRVKQEEYLERKQIEYGTSKVCWTSASKMEGAFQFSNDVHILTASDPANLLGLSLLTAALSELSFFIERGISPETIWRVYNDCKNRIYSRFGYRYFANTIMDSSPNSFDLPIDKYVFSGKAEIDKFDGDIRRNMVVTSTHWDVHPSKYPLWQRTGETFSVYRGDAGKPPKILGIEDIDEYDPNEIYHVPIDIRNSFEQDIKKMVKDYCGWPAGGDGKLIDDYNTIENMFSFQLQNINHPLNVSADKQPEELIWNLIYKDFFIQSGNGYVFYRAPNAYRSIHADLSESGDMTGLSMAHIEVNEQGEKVVVVDFSLALSPEKSRINLDAIPLFILDLVNKGRINIFKFTADKYASSNIIQRLKREGIDSALLSVDKSLAPYHTMISWMKNERIKAGRNVVLKNNLKSLVEITNDKDRQIIDHRKGKVVYSDSGDWEHSLMGINAKDVSDSVAGASFTMISEFKAIPRYQWSDSSEGIDEQSTTIRIEEEALNKVYEKYKMKVG